MKLLVNGETQVPRVDSGLDLTPQATVKGVLETIKGWSFEAISLGYPGAVKAGKIMLEPHNLGQGWVGFDFEKAFGCSVKIVNDATMQALGSY